MVYLPKFGRQWLNMRRKWNKHSTENELNYLKRIGNFHKDLGCEKDYSDYIRRLWLLEGYRNGMKDRKDWGDIEVDVIRDYVETSIDFLKKKFKEEGWDPVEFAA